MREGKYIGQVLKEFGELDEESVANGDPVKELMRVANHVAHEHPVRYERFRIRSAVVKGRRKLMGDFRDMRRDLAAAQRQRRKVIWHAFVVEFAKWGAAILAIIAVIVALGYFA